MGDEIEQEKQDEQTEGESEETTQSEATQPLSPEEAAEGGGNTADYSQQAPAPASGGLDPAQPRSTSAPPPEAQSGIPDIQENEGVEREEVEEVPTPDLVTPTTDAEANTGGSGSA